ncbi:pilus assembly protein PilM [Acidiferrobacter sp.]|uniref:pilus assembly protein PilM n=1 Tax=Acidiferrobacter sp. TaxID=1872107 RepID=UPI00262FA078|nr:pilus assembly protein PilM [Acidiferrobacter sp.]
MSLLNQKKPPLVGLDISTSSVKVLELSRSQSQYRVERYAVEPMPQNAVVERAIADVEQVSATIERAMKRSGTRLKRVAVSVPASQAISKTVRMSAALSESELQTQIEMEAEHHIPYPLDEVNVDFQVLGPAEDNAEEVDVLIAACRKEVVDEYVAVVQASGFQPVVVDLETYAIENAYGLLAEHMAGGGMAKTVAVYDIGATATTLSVMHNNRSVYSRANSFGGRQLTEEIQRRYGLSYEEAGLAKKQGGLPENYQSEVLRPFLEALCQEVIRSLQFFYSSSPFNKVDLILLAGGCAQIPAVDKLLASRVGVPVAIANPFAGMTLASRVKPQVFSTETPSLVIACGLALRSFDP